MKKIILGSLLIIFSSFIFSDSYPMLIIGKDNITTKIYGKLSLKKQEKFDSDFDIVRSNFKKKHLEMWQNFDIVGKDMLPWCIHQIFDKLKKRTFMQKYVPGRKSGKGRCQPGLSGGRLEAVLRRLIGELSVRREFIGIIVVGL